MHNPNRMQIENITIKELVLGLILSLIIGAGLARCLPDSDELIKKANYEVNK
jgi:hypothetical protein